MTYRNKTYVAFDADEDIRWYRLMQAWKANRWNDFNFYDAHDINSIWRRSQEATIKRRLKERMNNAKVFVLLLGEKTKNLHKFVRWEIEVALKLTLPMIVVNLNKKRTIDSERLPPILKDKLSISISYNQSVVQYALDEWPALHAKRSREGVSSPRQYSASVYTELGL